MQENRNIEHRNAWFRMIERNRAIPAPIRWLVLLGVFGLTIFWWITGSGLYAWLIEMENRVIGSFYPIYTLILTLLIVLALSFPLFVLIGYFFRNRSSEKGGSHSFSQQVQIWHDCKPRMFVWGVTSLIGAVMFGGIGGYFYLTGMFIGPKITVHYNNLPSPIIWKKHAEIDGYLQPQLAEGIQRKDAITMFIPITPNQTDTKCVILLKVSQYMYKKDHLAIAAKKKYVGLLSKNKLPVVVKNSLLEEGIIGKNFWILDYKDSPKEAKELGLAFVLFGGVFTILFLVIWYTQLRPMKNEEIM